MRSPWQGVNRRFSGSMWTVSPGVHFQGLEIAPGDSMYVFVEATLDPNGSDEILRIQDSIVFLTNGNHAGY